MRLVDLHLDVDRPVDLDLHRSLTVVVADRVVLDRVASILGRAYVVAGFEITGTLDTGEYLTPLDPTAVVALDLPGDGLRVLTSDALPPPDTSSREAARLASMAERDRLQEIVDEGHRVIEDLRQAEETTVGALSSGRDELAAAAARMDDLEAGATALDQRLPDLDAEQEAASDAAGAAGARIKELETGREILLRQLEPDGPVTSLRMGGKVGVLVTSCEHAASVGAISSDESGVLVGWLRDVANSAAPVLPAAQRLIDESAAVERAWEEAASVGVEGDPRVVAALAHRDRMDEVQRLLEKLSKSGVLGDTARSEIEHAHAAVVGADSSHGLSADEVVAREDEALARYGFDSFLDFTIAMSTRSVGQKAEAKRRSIVKELAAAEVELDAARDAAVNHLEHLTSQREPLRERAAAILGSWPDGPAEPLLAALPAIPQELVGLPDRYDTALETARDEARRYREVEQELVAERDALIIRRAELGGQRAHIQMRLTEIGDLLTHLESEAEVASRKVAEAEEAVRGPEAELMAVWRELEELEDAGCGTYTGDDIEPVAAALLPALDPWSVNPLPVVMNDTLGPLGTQGAAEVLRTLVTQVAQTQIIYLTDDPGLKAWAQGLDQEVGWCQVVVRPGWLRRRFGRRPAGRLGG